MRATLQPPSHYNIFQDLESVLDHHLDAVVGNPVEVFGCKSEIRLGYVYAAVLHAGKLILQTELELAEVVKDSRSESPHRVEIGEAILAEKIALLQDFFLGAEILDISAEEDSLDLATVCEAYPA